MSTGVMLFAMFLTAWGYIGGVTEDKDRQSQTSLSVRNPYQTHRVVNGDSLKNPTDFQIGQALEQKWEDWTSRAAGYYEGQDGERYVNTSLFLEHKGKRVIAGISMNDQREDGSYLQNNWAEARFGIVGFGMSRNYTRHWTEDASTMFRMSLMADQEFGPVTLVTHGTLEINHQRTHGRLRAEVRGIKHGRVSLVPFFVMNRVQPKHGDAVTRWQGKAMMTIDLDAKEES